MHHGLSPLPIGDVLFWAWHWVDIGSTDSNNIFRFAVRRRSDCPWCHTARTLRREL